MIEKGFTIQVGDANGADKAVERHLAEKGTRPSAKADRAHQPGLASASLEKPPTAESAKARGGIARFGRLVGSVE